MAKEDGQRTCFELGRTPGLGHVALFDGLEHRLGWRADGLLPIGAITRSQTFVFTGDWALKVGNRGPPPNGVGWWEVYRRIYEGGPGWMEVRARFKIDPDAVAQGYGFYVRLYRGGELFTSGFRYDRMRSVGQYFDGPRERWLDLAATGWLADEAWHEVWLRVDYGKRMYVSAGADSQVFDMSDKRIAEAETWIGDHVRLGIVTGRSGFAIRYVWIDDIMVRKIIEQS